MSEKLFLNRIVSYNLFICFRLKLLSFPSARDPVTPPTLMITRRRPSGSHPLRNAPRNSMISKIPEDYLYTHTVKFLVRVEVKVCARHSDAHRKTITYLHSTRVVTPDEKI